MQQSIQTENSKRVYIYKYICSLQIAYEVGGRVGLQKASHILDGEHVNTQLIQLPGKLEVVFQVVLAPTKRKTDWGDFVDNIINNSKGWRKSNCWREGGGAHGEKRWLGKGSFIDKKLARNIKDKKRRWEKKWEKQKIRLYFAIISRARSHPLLCHRRATLFLSGVRIGEVGGQRWRMTS